MSKRFVERIKLPFQNQFISTPCLSIEFRCAARSIHSIFHRTETSKSEILSGGIANTSIPLSCSLVSFDSRFFFFYRGRILLERARVEADLWVLPKDKCVLRDRCMAKQETRGRVIIVSCGSAGQWTRRKDNPCVTINSNDNNYCVSLPLFYLATLTNACHQPHCIIFARVSLETEFPFVVRRILLLESGSKWS